MSGESRAEKRFVFLDLDPQAEADSSGKDPGRQQRAGKPEGASMLSSSMGAEEKRVRRLRQCASSPGFRKGRISTTSNDDAHSCAFLLKRDLPLIQRGGGKHARRRPRCGS
mmetsp:Transcript_13722/g.26574  ORF Transcript_13722/g.26574 Transcript_13722/m.26574 type:complete len:111 (-) Transcript_13722:784-1116(-)